MRGADEPARKRSTGFNIIVREKDSVAVLFIAYFLYIYISTPQLPNTTLFP